MVNSSRLRIFLVLCCAVLAATSAVAQSSPIFFQPQSAALPTVSGGYGSSVYVFGDMDGDGKADVVYLSATGDNIAVQLHDGTQKPAVTLGCSINEGAVLIDLNSDGKLDFVTRCIDADMAVALGNGDGTFQTPLLIATPGVIDSFAFADMNGDGTMDLIGHLTSGPNSGQIMVGLIKGITLSPIHYYPVNGAVYSIVSGDLNGDGKADIATSGNGLTYWLGHGDGTLGTGTYLFEEGSQSCLAAADMNGDRFDDLITCSTYDDTVDELFGNSAGVLAVNTRYPDSQAFDGIFTVADLTGSGAKDLVFGSPVRTLEVLLNDGKGNLTLADGYADYSGYPYQLVDWDGDGHPDLLQTAPGGEDSYGSMVGPAVYVTTGNTNGTFNGSPSTDKEAATFGQTPAFAAGDFNGDGLQDFVSLTYQPYQYSLTTFLSLGDGTFKTVAGPAMPCCGTPVTADLNGDGKPDVALINDGLQMNSCINQGGGNFACGKTQTITNTGNHSLPIWAFADIDGDGKADMLYEQDDFQNGQVDIYLAKGNGDGTFQAAIQTNITLSTSEAGSAQPLVADLDGDGKPDLIFTTLFESQMPQTTVFMNHGGTTFVEQTAITGEPFAVADVTGDGKIDLMTAFKNVVYIYAGNGDGTFSTSPSIFTFTDSVTTIYSNVPAHTGGALGDVNGDGLPDIIVELQPQYGYPCSLGVLLNQGKGNFVMDTHTYSVPNGNDTYPLMFLGRLNSKSAASGTKRFLDASVVSASSLVSVLNKNNAAPAEGIPTITTLTASANPVGANSPDTLTVTVEGATGTAIPTGTVTIYDGSEALATLPLSGGKAKLAATTAGLPEGIYPLNAVYSGSSTFEVSTSATVTVSLTGKTAPTETYFVGTFQGTSVGAQVSIPVAVVLPAGSGTPTGTVSFSAVMPTGGVLNLGAAPLKNGIATYSAVVPENAPIGYYLVTASYNGSASYAPSKTVGQDLYVRVGTKTVITNYPTTVAPDDEVAFIVSVTNSNEAPANGSVQIQFGSTVVGSGQVGNGQGEVSAVIPSSLAAGKYAVTATFSSAQGYGNSTSAPVSVTVQ